MPCRAPSHGESRVLFEIFGQVHHRVRIDGIHYVGVGSGIDPAVQEQAFCYRSMTRFQARPTRSEVG